MRNLTEAILSRKSVRTFNGKSLSEEHQAQLFDFGWDEKNRIGPFGNHINLTYQIVDSLNPNQKIGTYGFIKNAPAFLIGICKNDKENLLDLGYVFENIVLYLQTIGIGTCWIGGTFNRNKLKLKHAMLEDEFIPIISPIGYKAPNKHLVEKVVRKMAMSDERKNFDEMFFYKNFETKIQDTSIRDKLEYVRMAPSASNKQPWRIVMDENGKAHFFLERTPKYGSALGYDIQMVDMGIALSHWMLASGKSNIIKETKNIELPNSNTTYLFSVD